LTFSPHWGESSLQAFRCASNAASKTSIFPTLHSGSRAREDE
jgi:hypothetical protein